MTDGWTSMPDTQPRTCRRCQKPCTLKQELWLSTGPGAPWTAHAACEIQARQLLKDRGGVGAEGGGELT